MNRRIIAFLFLLSGAAGLIYQVVWSRSLTLLFGSTTLAVSTVVAAFMAGLALGSYLFGMRADRVRKALPLYATLEIGIAITALLFPVFLKILTPVFLWLSWNQADSYLLFPLGRFLLCFLGLLLPTLLMGGTLPVLTRFFVKERATLGGNVSTLYALNTFGAMIGCLGAGFFLIPRLGIEGTTSLAVAFNLLSATGALIISRKETAGSVPAREPEAGAPAEAPGIAVSPNLVLWLFGVAGFTSLAYEVLWTRVLLFFLGWFAVYAFTIILTTFLFGIAAGSAAYSLFFRRGGKLLLWFAVIEIAIGIIAAASVATFGGLFEIIRRLEHVLPSDNWWQYIFARAGGSFALMLLPTFLMGLAFPLASALYARAGRGYGATVGNVYAANTVGAILGSLLAGFLLLPLLGLARSIALVALINLALGGFILLKRSSAGARRGLAAAALLILVGGGAINFLRSSDRPVILHSRHFKNPNKPMKLLYAHEGATASLAVLHDVNSGHDELNINGESTAYTSYADMQVHLMLSHLPLLLTEDPEKVLVVGFGMGATSWGAVLHPSVKEVRCVELVPNEVETARYFQQVNHGVLENEKFQLIIDDGRNYVYTTRDQFDLISFNAIHPSHSPALYTVEFYEECDKRLTDDGVICAWVPTNSFTERQFRTLLRTLTHVFPHSSLWYVNPNHLVLIGTRQRLRVPFESFRERMAYGPVRKDLARYTMEDPYQLLAYHLMDERDLDRYTRGAPINSDGKPYLEYSRELYTRPEIIDAMLYHRSSIRPYLEISEDASAVTDTLRRYEKAAFHLLAAQATLWLEAHRPDFSGRVWRADIEFRQAFRYLPGHANLRTISGIREIDEANLQSYFEQQPDDPEIQGGLLRIYIMRGDWETVAEILDRVRGEQTTEVALARALLHLQNERWDQAARYFEVVARGESRLLKRVAEQYLQAIGGERKRSADGSTTEELLALADRYWLIGDRERGEAAFLEAIAKSSDVPLPYFRFAHALEQAGRTRDAELFYAQALERPIKRADFRDLLTRSIERTRSLLALRENPNELSHIAAGDGSTIEVDPWSAAFRIRLGLLLLEQKMVDRASVELRLAVLLDEKNAEAHALLGRALALRGLAKEAEEELRLALSLDPNRRELEQEIRLIRSGGVGR